MFVEVYMIAGALVTGPKIALLKLII